MCTAISFKTDSGKCLFGRNMDLAYSFNQSPLFIPRNAAYPDRVNGGVRKSKYAVIGMGTMIDGYPAMAEAMNERGLACAGLNFAEYAHYEPFPRSEKINIAPYDFILWALSFDTVEQVSQAISGIELVDMPLNEHTPVPTLHWMITDRSGQSIVVEKTKERLSVMENPVGVMTNSPTFDWHLINLNEHMKLSPSHPSDASWGQHKMSGLGIGAGTLGMPGDFCSVSRFVRAAYINSHTPQKLSDDNAVAHFFNMLGYTAMVRGGVYTRDGMEDSTIYSSCMDLHEGVYYYKTRENSRINAVRLCAEDADSDTVKVFDYLDLRDINYQN